MRDETAEYLLPDGIPEEELAGLLGEGSQVRRRPSTHLDRVPCDTVDGRLFRRAEVLEAVEEEGRSALVWRRLGGELLRRLVVPPPRFAADLPPGPFRRRLEEVTDVRVLLPLARIETLRRAWELRDRRGKVVCRVFADEHRAASPDGDEARPLRARVRVEPVRGYPDAARQARAALSRLPGLEPAAGDLLLEALEALGRRPPDHNSKPRAALDPGMTAAEAVRRVLLGLLEALEANEEGARAALDPEFLHDFRVAVRRTRSALGQLGGVLPPAARERFRAGFGWLGSLTGPARDLDVHLLHLPEYRAALPPAAAADLEPLRELLAVRQEAEHRVVAEGLASGEYRGLVAEWRAFLEAGSGAWVQYSSDAPLAGRPVREVADARIARMLRRALREGRAIRDASPPEDLHELRKTCKKLRYLLEFFQGLYPGAEAGALIAALKKLQDNLGAHHDVHVQSEALAGYARELEGAAGGAGAQRALGMLLEQLRVRETRLRAEFARRFAAFADDAARSRFRAAGGRRKAAPAGEGREGS